MRTDSSVLLALGNSIDTIEEKALKYVEQKPGSSSCQSTTIFKIELALRMLNQVYNDMANSVWDES